MNPKTNYSLQFARPLPAASGASARSAGEIPNLYMVGLTQAVELAKAGLETSICLNSCLADVCRHFLWYTPGFGYWYDAGNKAFAEWVEMYAHLLNQMLPASGNAQNRPGDPTRQETEEEFEEIESGIDIAVEAFEDEILA